MARPTIAMGLLLAGLLLATAFVALAIQRNALARETAGLQADIIAQQARRARLEAELAEKAGDSYVVDKARDYGYVKPGEAIIGVKQEPKIAAPPVTVTPPSRAQLWLALFFGAR
ncbi:MAG TPA: septum formation initiator family protein [Candidatus Saccharimonadales bacterium]|nr:septum formation initiator family protein [Candidatus Saccharimonadales bacterium]